MKTLKLFAISMAFLFVSGSAFAQTTIYDFESYEYGLILDCGEGIVDVISGPWSFSYLVHNSPNNTWVKLISHNSEYVSDYTGEKYREVFISQYTYYRANVDENIMVQFSVWRLIGDMGTRLIATYTIEWDTNTGNIISYDFKLKCM